MIIILITEKPQIAEIHVLITKKTIRHKRKAKDIRIAIKYTKANIVAPIVSSHQKDNRTTSIVTNSNIPKTITGQLKPENSSNITMTRK